MTNTTPVEVTQLLREAVDQWVEAVGSGRLGFDYAVKEYVENYDNVLSWAFSNYVQALEMGSETSRQLNPAEETAIGETRRAILHTIAKRFEVPALTTFVMAVLEAQDHRLSIFAILEQQANQLRQTPLVS